MDTSNDRREIVAKVLFDGHEVVETGRYYDGELTDESRSFYREQMLRDLYNHLGESLRIRSGREIIRDLSTAFFEFRAGRLDYPQFERAIFDLTSGR